MRRRGRRPKIRLSSDVAKGFRGARCGMFGINDHNTVRLLARRPLPHLPPRSSPVAATLCLAGRPPTAPAAAREGGASCSRPSPPDHAPARRPYHHRVLVGRTGLSPVMVGRAVELDRLAALVGARPVPSVALVSGEAGIGKTRLVQELVRRAPGGTLVLAGQADPGTVGRPMELLLDAVDAAALGAGRGRRRRRRRSLGPRGGRARRRPHGRGARAGGRRPRAGAGRPGRRRRHARRVRGPALGRLRERHRVRAPRRAAPAGHARCGPRPRARRHLPARRPVAPPPRGRGGPAARAAPPRDPRPPRPPDAGRRQRVPGRGVRPGTVVPHGGRPAHAHGREPLLPRGAGVGGGGDAGGRRRRPRCRGRCPSWSAPSSTTSTPRCGRWSGPRRCSAGGCRSTCWRP